MWQKFNIQKYWSDALQGYINVLERPFTDPFGSYQTGLGPRQGTMSQADQAFSIFPSTLNNLFSKTLLAKAQLVGLKFLQFNCLY